MVSDAAVTKCRLLSLPIEVRTKIYEYTLISHAGHMEVEIWPSGPHRLIYGPGNLVLTNPQIRAEASRVFFKANTVVIHIDSTHSAAPIVLPPLVEENIHFVRTIIISMGCFGECFRLNSGADLSSYSFKLTGIGRARRDHIAVSQRRQVLDIMVADGSREGQEPVLTGSGFCKLLCTLQAEYPSRQRLPRS